MRRGTRTDGHFSPRAYPVIRTRDSEGRQLEASEHLARPKQAKWTPATALQLPVDDGFDYRWVREYTNGEMDTTRMSRMMREEWTVVPIDEMPPGFVVDPDLHGDGYARHGGLILMRLPKEVAALRRAYYAKRRAAVTNGADELQGVANKAEPGRSVVGSAGSVQSLSGDAALRAVLNR